MKKIALLLSALLLISVFAGCVAGEKPYEDRTLIRLGVLAGPTGMGAVKLMSDNDAKLTMNRYETQIVTAPDDIQGKIATGELDIAAVPTNLAAALYNKTSGGVQVIALNTLGVLYVLENGDSVQSVADLKGKELLATGQGAVPEYALNFVLEQSGLDPASDLTVTYKSEHSELATLAASGMADLVMLPEPFVTTVLSKNENFRVALDLTKEWEALAGEDSTLTMGCLIVRKEFAEKNKEALDRFLEEYGASTAYVNENVTDASALVQQYGIMASAELAAKAIPNCNITCITGDELQTKLSAFYDVLFAANAKSVGGSLPGEDFFYKK